MRAATDTRMDRISQKEKRLLVRIADRRPGQMLVRVARGAGSAADGRAERGSTAAAAIGNTWPLFLINYGFRAVNRAPPTVPASMLPTKNSYMRM